VITVFSDKEWETLCEAMDRPLLAAAPKFNTITRRKNNEEELDKILSEWTSKLSGKEIEVLLQRMGVAAHFVESCADVFTDEQLLHRKHYVYIEHPEIGAHAHSSLPATFSKTPALMWRSGPCMGEDNVYVYKEILGLSDDDISELYAEGVITTEAQLPF
jgi:crotonobetainyl-CoA:carnitine CoA-transferase CaiB-like acyl-CoA transferase